MNMLVPSVALSVVWSEFFKGFVAALLIIGVLGGQYWLYNAGKVTNEDFFWMRVLKRSSFSLTMLAIGLYGVYIARLDHKPVSFYAKSSLIGGLLLVALNIYTTYRATEDDDE